VILRRSFSAALLIFLISISASNAQQILTTEDLTVPVSLSEAKISPDGKKAVFLVTRSYFESNSQKTELILVELESGRQTILSRQKGIMEPCWAPASDRISFLADTKMGEQIFVFPLQARQPHQITQIEGGLLHHTWSPDGNRFALIAQEKLPEKKGTEHFNDSFEAGSNDYLTTEAPKGNYVGILATNGGKVQRITPPGTTVATDFFNSSLSWSPDGKQLAINIYPTSRSGDSDLGRVHLLDIESNTTHPVTPLTGQMGPGIFSADGSRILFSYPRDGVPANESELYAVNASSGESKSVTRALDREIFDFTSLDKERLLVGGYDGLRSAIWLVNDSGAFTPLDLGDVMEVLEFNANKKGSIVFIGEEMYRPSELYFKSSSEAKPERITSFNQQISERKQGRREGFSWKSPMALKRMEY
jgi:Tol biopolymer transport system component